ncbi:winged helix DNA-binding domain-containing protein [Actinoplanes sp. RD1]|uniref:winged helix DNA-binding domain-containing protein n=1 Tax=Actinoplanes sp. RD1 TaxID=3064538 RepID=UPI00274194FF|nr:winged helix DNA-binding domain-containing protein [Actinoplanes sp. RD1]
MKLTFEQAAALRMHSLMLTPGKPAGVPGVVEWFGAVQAHDVGQAAWALGIRVPGSTEEGVQAELERGEVVRTWAFRGSSQVVPAADARWMLRLTGVRALTGSRRPEKLGVDQPEGRSVLDALPAMLRGRRLTVPEIQEELPVAHPGLADLLWYAGLQGVVCLAPQTSGKHRYMLLDELATTPVRDPGREEALALVAVRYFRSHGPASRADLARWTGLTVADAKQAIAAAGDQLSTVTVGDTEMYACPDLLALDPAVAAGAWAAVPGLDECVTAFHGAPLLIDPTWAVLFSAPTSGVRPGLLVHGGRVMGTWKRVRRGATMTFDVQLLEELGPAGQEGAEAALARVAAFHSATPRVRWSRMQFWTKGH